MIVWGQVLDPDGKPVVGAQMVLSAIEQDLGDRRLGMTGPDGHFEVAIPGTAFSPADAGLEPRAALVAIAPGLGPDWWPIDPAKRAEPVILRLRRDDVPIEGRILGRDGRPIAGVGVEVGVIADFPDEQIKKLRETVPKVGEPSFDLDPGNVYEPGEGDPIRPVRTDADGRFRLTGIGRDRMVVLSMSGGSIEQSQVFVSTSAALVGKPLVIPGAGDEKIEGSRFDLTVAPGRTLEGTVRDRETGQAIADARILCLSTAGGSASGSSDAGGRYRLEGVPMGQEVFLTVDAYKQPYIKASLTLEDQADPARLDIGLTRGVWAAGRVTDAANGKPVKATIHYCPARDNPHAKDCPDAPFLDDRLPYGSVLETDRDGRFRAAVLPGRGLISVQAREPGFLKTRPLDQGAALEFLHLRNTSYLNVSSHAFRPIDPPADKGLDIPEIRLARGGSSTSASPIRMAGRWPEHASAAASSIGPTCDCVPCRATSWLSATRNPATRRRSYSSRSNARSVGWSC